MDILHSLFLVACSHKIFHSKSNSTCRKSTHLLLKQSATIYKFLTKQQSGYKVDLLEILLILLSPAEHTSFSILIPILKCNLISDSSDSVLLWATRTTFHLQTSDHNLWLARCTHGRTLHFLFFHWNMATRKPWRVLSYYHTNS